MPASLQRALPVFHLALRDPAQSLSQHAPGETPFAGLLALRAGTGRISKPHRQPGGSPFLAGPCSPALRTGPVRESVHTSIADKTSAYRLFSYLLVRFGPSD